MKFIQVKNNRKYIWTTHAKYKMTQYNIGVTVIKRVLSRPDRVEEGIAINTVAVMKDVSSKTIVKELWVMYQMVGVRKKIISVWIYPGKTKPGREIYIPEDAWLEIKKGL